MSSPLEDLLKLSGHNTEEELLGVLHLNFNSNGMSFLPESIGLLTNLVSLNLGWNHLSSLPESIGRLKNLNELFLDSNPITELPQSITCLRNLSELMLVHQYELTVQRAPVGITALPCWKNDTNKHGSKFTPSEVLKQLQLYKYENENLTDISSLIGKWKACDKINISKNRISTLPDQLSTLTELCDLNIADNAFVYFPNVLLEMTWLTSLNIAGNSFTELPEGITNLSKLANLVIRYSCEDIFIQRVPIEIFTLPCYKTNPDLRNIAGVLPSSLILRWRLENSPIQNATVLLEKELKKSGAPVLVRRRIDVSDASEAACKKGVLCLLCLKPFLDPCALNCGHIFCYECLNNTIQESRLRVPFACPTCHEPSVLSEEISEDMKIAAQPAKLRVDSIGEEILSPKISEPMCQRKSCKEKATHTCIKCGTSGLLCQTHLKIHDEFYDDHIGFVREIIPGTLPTHANLVCPIHKTFEVKYYCKECPEKPFKCAECHADDHQSENLRLHKYIQYRGVDSPSFEEILTGQLAKINESMEVVKISQMKIDEESTRFYQSLDEIKSQALQYIVNLKALVNQLEYNINMQLDNLEKNCKHELDYKHNEFHADEVRLELSKKLISEAIQTYREMKPTELESILKFSQEIVNQPKKELRSRTIVGTERLPRELLSQLESLNRQLMFGLCPEASSNQDSQPESSISPAQIKSFVFDQASDQYFGIGEDRMDVIAANRQQKVVRKIPVHLFIEGGIHSLQGISASKDGVLAVADIFANTVTLYDTKMMGIGLVLRDFGDGRDHLFNSPRDVAFDSQGRLFVVDSGSKSVIVFNEHFIFSHKIDVANVQERKVNGIPSIIEIGHEGNISVYFTESNSVVEFDNEFNFMMQRIL